MQCMHCSQVNEILTERQSLPMDSDVGKVYYNSDSGNFVDWMDTAKHDFIANSSDYCRIPYDGMISKSKVQLVRYKVKSPNRRIDC